jgi:hypothetical protein
MSATPLHTSPMDLYNIGAMVGILGLSSISGFEEMEEFRKEIAKKKKSISKSDLEDERERLMEKGTDATKSLDMSSAIQEVREKTMEFVTWIAECYQGRIIRRTASSKDWQGNLLNKLDPYAHKYIQLDPTEQELDHLHALEAGESREGYVHPLGFYKQYTDVYLPENPRLLDYGLEYVIFYDVTDVMMHAN